jgi:secreted trypsin-like serine protease
MAGRGRRRCVWLLLVVGALLGATEASAATAGGARHGGRSVSHKAPARRAPRARTSVVGGAQVSIARFPFQVALYNPKASSPAAGFFCGGVIIDDIHVATAAHCIAGGGPGPVSAPTEVEVLAGSTHLAPADSGSVRDPVTAARIDARYNPSTSDYDVGVLTLARKLWSGPASPSLNGTNTIAPLPVSAAQAASYASPSSEQAIVATVSGWGDLNPAPGTGPSYPATLQATRVPLVSDWGCSEDYAAIEQTITPRMICAGDAHHRADSCYGDSGGPLVVNREDPARPPGDYVLVGLVDFGNGCAQAGYPGVYARIANADIASFLAAGVGRRATLAGRQGKKKHRRHKRRH